MPLERVSLYHYCNWYIYMYIVFLILFLSYINLIYDFNKSTFSFFFFFWVYVIFSKTNQFSVQRTFLLFAIGKFSKFLIFPFLLRNRTFVDSWQLFDHSFSRYLILLLFAAIFSRDLLQTRLISTEGSNGL